MPCYLGPSTFPSGRKGQPNFFGLLLDLKYVEKGHLLLVLCYLANSLWKKVPAK